MKSNTGNPLEDLLREQLADIYYAEKHILKALPKMIKAAESPELEEALRAHQKETETHIVRIEDSFEELGLKPKAKKCEAILGILKEGDEIAEAFAGTEGIDAALICAAQKVEHYEVATYGCLVTWAKVLGHDRVAEWLAETLEEEEAADSKLSEVAEDVANSHAAVAA